VRLYFVNPAIDTGNGKEARVMTDRSVEKEIEANERRKELAEEDDDPAVVDALEEVFDPITDAIRRTDDDQVDEVDRQTVENDAEQR
jgi:hypothetical protein